MNERTMYLLDEIVEKLEFVCAALKAFSCQFDGADSHLTDEDNLIVLNGLDVTLTHITEYVRAIRPAAKEEEGVIE